MYDISLKEGKVISIQEKRAKLIIVEIEMSGGGVDKAYNFTQLTGDVHLGDQVIVNTTAVELGLGTGGYHFICYNLDNKETHGISKESGHIMKLRYTPFQLRTLCLEEEASEYHQQINHYDNLAGHPVVIIPLHSLLAVVVIIFKHLFPEKKAIYIMTEGGSLALDLSQQVYILKESKLLDETITVGHAFGGDLEAVNLFSGLIAAKKIAQGDLIICGMGPGIVGTGTRLGFSGTENAFVNYAVNILQGRSIIVPRVSQADQRQRHYGISHHTITLLTSLIDQKVDLPLPDHNIIKQQVAKYNLNVLHNVFYYSSDEIKKILNESSFPFNSMGRKIIDDPLFYITAGLAVYRWQEIMRGERLDGIYRENH